MIDYLKGRNEEEKEKPFLAYLAYTAPHWPLQAPQEVIDKYKGQYSDGPEALRKRRLDALIARGLVPADVEPAPMVGEMTKEWADMNDDEKAHSARRMETYAAMVDLIDQNLARVVSYLEETGELDNTFVMFISDNASAIIHCPFVSPIPSSILRQCLTRSRVPRGNYSRRCPSPEECPW